MSPRPKTAELSWGIGSLALFVLIAVLIRTGGTALTSFDLHVAHGLHRYVLAHPGQVAVWHDISAVLSPAVLRIASVVAAVVVFLLRREAWAALVLMVPVLGTLLLSPLTKVLVDRDRPQFAHPVAHAAGQSYPSGHALTSFVTLGAILVLCSPPVRRLALAPAVLIVAAVGFSRLILGVHYVSDVVGGWLLGTAELCLVLVLLRPLRFTAGARG